MINFNLLVCFHLFLLSSSSVIAEDASLFEKSKEVLRILRSPNDTPIQIEAKEAIAIYLVENTLDEETAGRIGASFNLNSEEGLNQQNLIVSYGKHHHGTSSISDSRYNDLLLQLQKIQLEQAQAAQKAQLEQAQKAQLEQAQKITQAQQAPISQNVAKQENLNSSASTDSPIKINEGVTNLPIITQNSQQSTQISQSEKVTAAPINLPTLATLPPRVTVDPVHHLNQVNKILGNVANGNIVGIVDESLAIRAPPPVRNLVTNIMKIIFCNPIDRLFGRCAPNQIDAAQNSVKG